MSRSKTRGADCSESPSSTVDMCRFVAMLFSEPTPMMVAAVSSENQSLLASQNLPASRRQPTKLKSPNSHADQPQGRMSNRSGHPSHLTILAFDEFQSQP